MRCRRFGCASSSLGAGNAHRQRSPWRLVALGLIAVGLTLVASCGGETAPVAIAPTPTVPVVAGTWEGGATARACTASGCVSNPCRFLYDINGNFVSGAPSPLRLTLQQSRTHVTGTVQLALDSIFSTKAAT